MRVSLELFNESDWQRYPIDITPQGQEIRPKAEPTSDSTEEIPVDSAALMCETAEKVVLAATKILHEALERVKAMMPAMQTTVTDESTAEVLASAHAMLTKLISSVKKDAREQITEHCNALGRLKDKVKELKEAKKEAVEGSDSWGIVKFLRKFFIEHNFTSWNTERKLTNTITEITASLKMLA